MLVIRGESWYNGKRKAVEHLKQHRAIPRERSIPRRDFVELSRDDAG